MSGNDDRSKSSRFADERLPRFGHRAFVGGSDPDFWYGIGKLQYHYLIANGLKPHHTFLDVGCGSLRLGQYLIPYLDSGRYYGLDGEREVVEVGLAKEFYAGIERLKAPKFAYNFDFDVSFVSHFDMAIAQSLFTHLVLDDIEKCFRNIASAADQESRFYFTFFERTAESPANLKNASDPHENWYYTFEEIAARGRRHDWKVEYIGDWQHPRKQKLALATR